MNRIVVLSQEISMKIAAGEVIERPYSVVKELVDNALDAGADDIRVELLEGGKKLVKVADNGCGMSPDDARLCFERHSTSKVLREADLASISTLGFRGEALPSISAVSRVLLKTSDGTRRGTLVEREGESLLRFEEVAFPRGTSVEVRDLFFNLPARRKFLRSERAELGMVVRYLTYLVLAYPEVRFSLSHGKREIFHYPQVSSLKERIFQVFGKQSLENLVEVDFHQDVHLYGYVSRPPSGRRDRNRQFFFVNRRPVRDKIIQAAVGHTCQGKLEKDLYPEVFLCLYISYSEVDVNVHPAKAEVRFKNSQDIFRQVAKGLECALLPEKGIREIYPAPGGERAYTRIKERGKEDYVTFPRQEMLPGGELFAPEKRGGDTYPQVLGQYLNTYIVASTIEGILVIDQHNAHERVLFERYQDIDARKKWPVKISLIPQLLELAPSQELVLEENTTLFEEMGFRVESMGQRTYALKEYPDIFLEEEAREIFLSLLEEVEGEKVEKRRAKVLATLACKTAVKAGQILSTEKMSYLVEELLKASNFSVCPHGRPVLLRLEKREIEKGMKRQKPQN